MKRRAFLVATAGATGALVGCVDGRARGDDHDVGMSATRFLPAEYEATVGEPVVWANTSSRAHSVTAYEERIPDEADYFASGGYDSEEAARDDWVRGDGGRIFEGERYEYVFEVPGTYHYFCIPHEPSGMVGTVVVTE